MKQCDYISREVAIEQFRKEIDGGYVLDNDAQTTRILKSIPAADVRPVVRGKWIDRDDKYYGWNMWACSACGEEFVLTEGTPDMNDYHFCPNCGAKMECNK